MSKKLIATLSTILILLQCLVFPPLGQAAEPHLVAVYINETLSYSPTPVYLTASALYSDGTVKDVTYSGTWKSSNENIATVYRGKVEFGKGTGNVTITFTYGGLEAKVGTEVVEITELRITTRNIKYSTKPVQLKVQGRYNNGELKDIKEHVTWYSTNERVAKVDSTGLVTFRGNEGIVRIGVIYINPRNKEEVRDEIEVIVTEKDIEKYEEPEETKAFTVKIDGELDPKKKTTTLKAYRLYEDNTKKTLSNDLVTWSSSNPGVAEVTDDGRVTFTGKPGNVTITVYYRSYSASVSTFVPYKMEELSINESLNFTPYFFTNPPKLSVTGKDNSGQSQLVHGLVWTSSNLDVANIDNSGQITFTGKPGTVTFTASKDGLSTSINVTVPEDTGKKVKKIFMNPSLRYSTEPVELKAYALMEDGTTEEITRDCRWTSSNEKVAAVLDGWVYFTGQPGTVEISCTYQGFSDKDKVLVYPAGSGSTLSGIKFADHYLTYSDNGKTLQVLGLYSNNAVKPLSNVKFYSFHPNIAKVQNDKIFFTGLPGSATIVAQAGNFRATVEAQNTSPSGDALPVFIRIIGELDSYQKTKELKTMAVFADGRTMDVTGEAVWNTTNTNLVKLGEKGRVEVIGIGPVRVSATYKNLNAYLSNKAYYQFNMVNPIKTNLVPLSNIKTRIQEKLAQNVNLPLPSDIIGHWAQKELEMARKLGWMGGYQDGTMRPNNTISRGEFASLLERALYLKTNNRFVSFTDTQNHWAKESIDILANLGIVPIDGTRRFRPDDPITRCEIAQIMNNLIQLRAYNYYSFLYVPPGHHLSTAIANTVQAGIMGGMDNLYFKPEEKATRAQALSVLLRLLKTDPELEGILNRY